MFSSTADPAVKQGKVFIDSNDQPTMPTHLNRQCICRKHFGMGKVELQIRRDRRLYLNGKAISLYVSPSQKIGGVVGHQLVQELANVPTLNSRILDALFENPGLIPDEWEDGPVYFFSTEFESLDGRTFVQHLRRVDGHWWRFTSCLNGIWYLNQPAAYLEES